MSEALLAKRRGDIRQMFGRIASRYDLLNRVLSLGRDVGWRRALANRTAAQHPQRVLDVCTGTGDVALSFAAEVAVVGCDFCLPMLSRARHKALARRRRLPLVAADALQMPLPDAVVDVVTVAFGVRNFENLEAGLGELVRLLKGGGSLLILEFSHPKGLLAPLLSWWVHTVPPRLGRWISGDPQAYSYLPDSVGHFARADEMCALLGDLGLVEVRAHALTGGVATLYEGRKRV